MFSEIVTPPRDPYALAATTLPVSEVAAIQASEPAIEENAVQKRAKAEQDEGAPDADAQDGADDEEDFLLAHLEAAEDDEFVEDE